MSTNLVKNDDNTVVVTKIVEGDEWKNARKKVFNEQKARLNIKGFRKGHVPANVAKKMIPDAYVNAMAAEDLAQPALNEMIDEYNLEVIDRPTFDYKDEDAQDDQVTLRFIVEVAPEAELGEYKGFGIKKDEVEVSDEEVNDKVHEVLTRYADMVLVEDETTPAAKGDSVTVDYKGTIDGEAFEGGTAQDASVKLGQGRFIPGFEDGIIGMTTGETKDVNVTFPENYGAEELAGKDAVFAITVKKIEKEELPELDEEFFENVYNVDGVNNEEEMRAAILESLKKEKEDAAEQKFINEVVEKAVENAKVDIPEVMINSEVNQMFQDTANRIANTGLSVTDYLTIIGQTPESVKASFRPEAEKRIKTTLVLDAIVKAENLAVAAEKLEEEYQSLADMYRMPLEDVKKAIREKDLTKDLLRSEAVDFLENNQ